ncbi:HAMP domain-containing protein [bacterium]|nr:HAMP domain-containing protein [bacterium]
MNSFNHKTMHTRRQQCHETNNKDNSHPLRTMVSATHIVELGLIVVTQKLNKQDALETNQQVRKTMLWGWILFLIALAVSYAAAAGLTQRIMELVKSTLQIASGNLNIQLAESANDEVGFLSRSINRMASDIQVLLHVREIAVRQHTELKMAENIQKMLIPETQTQRAGITTQAFFKPATECAGDWWGRFSFGEKKEMIVLADATGHGAHAAIIVSLAYSYFSTLEIQMREGKQVDTSPLQVAKELNAVLFSAGHGQSTMTVFILLFDLEEQKVHALSAGHCMPFMLIENTSNVIGCSGSVLGSTVNLETTIKTLDLQPEQRFLLYTDGLFECTNSDKKMIKKRLFNEKLAAWNKHSLEILSKNVFSLIEEHFEDHPLTDDITLVLIEHNLQKNALSAEAKTASSELALVPEKKERLETNANTEPERKYFEDIVPRKDWQII